MKDKNMKNISECIKTNDVKSLENIYDSNYINKHCQPFPEFILCAGFQVYLKENPNMTLNEINKLIDFKVKIPTKKEFAISYRKRFCRYKNFQIKCEEGGSDPLILCNNNITAFLPKNPIRGQYYGIKLGKGVITGILKAHDNFPFYGENVFDQEFILNGEYNSIFAFSNGKDWYLY